MAAIVKTVITAQQKVATDTLGLGVLNQEEVVAPSARTNYNAGRSTRTTYTVRDQDSPAEQDDVSAKYDALKFNGSGDQKDEVDAYIVHCELVFNMRPKQFKTDQAKISYMIINFRSGAARWINPYLKLPQYRKPTWLLTYSAFAAELLEQYGDPHEKENASDEISRIRQKANQSAREFYRAFQEIAIKLPHWSDESLANHFYKGLRYELKVSIGNKYAKHPTTLYGMREAAFNADYSLSTLKRDKDEDDPHKREASQANKNQDSTQAAARGGQYQGGPRRDTPPANPRLFDSTRPRSDRPRRTPEEEALYQQRMKDGLCAGCGSKDHNYAKCPRNPMNRSTLTSMPPLTPETKARSVTILQRGTSTINKLDEEEDDEVEAKN
jgi:hypothetical protein